MRVGDWEINRLRDAHDGEQRKRAGRAVGVVASAASADVVHTGDIRRIRRPQPDIASGRNSVILHWRSRLQPLHSFSVTLNPSTKKLLDFNNRTNPIFHLVHVEL